MPHRKSQPLAAAATWYETLRRRGSRSRPAPPLSCKERGCDLSCSSRERNARRHVNCNHDPKAKSRSSPSRACARGQCAHFDWRAVSCCSSAERPTKRCHAAARRRHPADMIAHTFSARNSLQAVKRPLIFKEFSETLSISSPRERFSCREYRFRALFLIPGGLQKHCAARSANPDIAMPDFPRVPERR